jgi:Lrp/AsnC family transcriptional regulator, leucine-responsive regulatory protein
MDATDRAILVALVRNARISYRELGDHVSLSANATAERVRRLQDSGVIAGFTTLINPTAAGRTLIALIDVRLNGPGDSERCERLIESLEPITEATHVTGRFDYQLRIACRDTAELDSVIRTLKSRGGVVETDTRLGLRTVVHRAEPLPAAQP